MRYKSVRGTIRRPQCSASQRSLYDYATQSRAIDGKAACPGCGRTIKLRIDKLTGKVHTIPTHFLPTQA